MTDQTLMIEGELMGIRMAFDRIHPPLEIVRIIAECRPLGPAENSIIVVESLPEIGKRGRYLSWIGYADLDEISVAESGKWTLVEPAKQYQERIVWAPFG